MSVLSDGRPGRRHPPLPGLFVEHAGAEEVRAVPGEGQAQDSGPELLEQETKGWFHLPRSGLPCYSGVVTAGVTRPVGGCGNTRAPVPRRARSAAPRSANAPVCSQAWTRVASLTSLGLFPH